MPRSMTIPEIRACLQRVGVMTLTGTDADGNLVSRPMHVAVTANQIIVHASLRGAKQALFAGPVVASAYEIVARIPSWFTDPVRACPASTLYWSVTVNGALQTIEVPDEKTAALHAYSVQLQPEGRFEPITREDAGYAAQLDRLVVSALPLSAAIGRAKLGTEKPAGWRKRVATGLWQRGEPGDFTALELLRAEAPDTRLPAAFKAPSGVSLHQGQATDLAPAVALLTPQYWNVEMTPDRIRRAHEGATAWVVARVDGQLVGTARAMSDGGKIAWIYDVAVADGWRGKGVGTALMQLLCDHPAVRRARKVLLRTVDGHPFYRRLGFEDPPPRASTAMLRTQRD